MTSRLFRWHRLIIVTGLVLAAVAVLAVAAGAAARHKVTPDEFNAIASHQRKADVESIIGTGTYVVEWAGGKGWFHQWDNYPANDGSTVEVFYSHAPGKKRWHVQVHRYKGWCPEANVPCNDGAPTS